MISFFHVFKWDRFVAPSMAELFFWLLTILSLLIGLSGVMAGIASVDSAPAGSLLLIAFSIIGAIAGIVGARMFCEFVVMTFRVNENLMEIRDATNASLERLSATAASGGVTSLPAAAPTSTNLPEPRPVEPRPAESRPAEVRPPQPRAPEVPAVDHRSSEPKVPEPNVAEDHAADADAPDVRQPEPRLTARRSPEAAVPPAKSPETNALEARLAEIRAKRALINPPTVRPPVARPTETQQQPTRTLLPRVPESRLEDRLIPVIREPKPIPPVPSTPLARIEQTLAETARIVEQMAKPVEANPVRPEPPLIEATVVAPAPAKSRDAKRPRVRKREPRKKTASAASEPAASPAKPADGSPPSNDQPAGGGESAKN